VRRHIDEAGITLAELADSLVRTEAISFRQAHEVASKLARRMIDGGMTLSRIRSPSSSRYSPRRSAARAPARRRFPALHHAGAFHRRAHDAGGPRRRRSRRASRAIATRSRTKRTASGASPRASAPRKTCWRAKSPGASRARSQDAWRNWH
jgi:argininosuccinate lyase